MRTPDSIMKFYHSKRWKRVRRIVINTNRGRCQECGKAGWEVHHIIPLTEQNLTNPDIAINPDNLMLLCTRCHDSMRTKDKYIRADLEFTVDGDVVKKKDTPHPKSADIAE